MGQSYSCCWANDQVKQYLRVLVELLGQPYIYVNKPGGVALWRKTELTRPGVMLFGKPVCFDKVMIYDNPVMHNYPKPHSDFLWIFVKASLSKDQVEQIGKIADTVGYDTLQQMLWVRCGSLEMDIATLKLCTDLALKKISLGDAISLNTYSKMILALQNADGTSNLELTKNNYQGLCDNLTSLMAATKKERLTDPWYASNNPIDIALAESEDAKYYQNYQKSKREHLDPNPNCKGACLRRIQAMQTPRREHMEGDARFALGAAAIHYETDSQTNDITRTYGTVSQRVQYPTYTDYVRYGWASVPTNLPQETKKKNISTDFTPPPSSIQENMSSQRYNEDPYLEATADANTLARDPFLRAIRP